MTVRRRIARLEQRGMMFRRGDDMTDDELLAFLASNDERVAQELAATGTVSDQTLRRLHHA